MQGKQTNFPTQSPCSFHHRERHKTKGMRSCREDPQRRQLPPASSILFFLLPRSEKPPKHGTWFMEHLAALPTSQAASQCCHHKRASAVLRLNTFCFPGFIAGRADHRRHAQPGRPTVSVNPFLNMTLSIHIR
ncbi:unnamed protein product [Periconia digitata]|uniref:Uncharacterized protein n=1 Tax=Periconia digitata TaxID=1303443 RepID=A0A9W4XIG8_9PLEO|nr:unnamed protein product [Periconia digitata]